MNNGIMDIYVIIFGMAIVTYFCRGIPIAVLKGRRLNRKIAEWMSFIPAAVLSALLMPALIINAKEHSIDISVHNLFLIAGVLTFVFGFFVRNLFAVIIFGIAVLALIRRIY